MRKILFILVVLFGTTLNAQDVKESKSRMDEFVSQTGVIMKYQDYNAPKIDAMYYASTTTKIRKVMTDSGTKIYLIIRNKGKYNTRTASFTKDDIPEVLKAITLLQEESVSDLATSPNYLENKFITEDGAEIGYYISDSKLTWYLKLEKYGSDNTLHLKSINSVIELFQYSENKISTL